MRRRYPKKSLFLFILIILALISISYSFLSSRLSIIGNVSGKSQSNPYILQPGFKDLKANINITNSWVEGSNRRYQYNILLRNVGAIDLDNFIITIVFESNVLSPNVWNYDNKLIDNKTLQINNQKTILKADDDLDISFQISSSHHNLKIYSLKLEARIDTDEVNPDNFIVKFTPSNSWGSYTYQYNVELTNKTGVRITYWQLDIILPSGTVYESGWNGIFSFNENILTIKNTSYNGNLDNNAKTTFGLQINTNIINYIPNNIKITVR